MKKTSNVKRYHVWHASLLLFMIALIMIGGIFEISHSPTLDSQIMPHKPLFDHSRYQYHPPEPRHEEWGIGHDPECGSGPSFDWFFQNLSNPNHRSVNNEDKTIYNTLFQRAIAQDPQKRHTYIELGAFDGLTESNTRFFDECLNWDGLLIEGNPVKFPLLLQNRPHAHRLNFAPGCRENSTNETIPFHSVHFTNGGVAGFAKDYPEGHKIVQVPCGSLTPVLQELAPNGVDFFSLDVEGSEPLIVGNIDFGKVHIDVLMVESWNGNCPREPNECETRTKTRAILQKAGYRRFSNVIQKSDLYVHLESPYLVQLPPDLYPMYA
jgi:hypothetical protein